MFLSGENQWSFNKVISFFLRPPPPPPPTSFLAKFGVTPISIFSKSTDKCLTNQRLGCNGNPVDYEQKFIMVGETQNEFAVQIYAHYN